MAWNGSGAFNRVHNWVNDRDAAIDITASRCDAEDDNFATGIQACLAKNGENSPTANLPMNSKKHTGVANATARDQYTALGQFQDGAVIYGSAGGAADVQTLTLSPAITAYTAGQRFSFIPVADNTGSATLNVNSLGAKTIKTQDGNTLVAGMIDASGINTVEYNGTDFILLDPVYTQITGITAGTAAANKAVVLDASKDVSGINAISSTSVSTGTVSATGAMSAASVSVTSVSATTYNAGALANGMTATTQSPNDNSTKVATTAYVDASEIFSDSYYSGAQTITSGGSLQLTHSLSTAPLLVQALLICTSAEYGYSINDEVIINGNGNDVGSAAARGLSIVSDATYVNIRFGSNANAFAVIRKDTGATNAITNSSWSLKIRAWA